MNKTIVYFTVFLIIITSLAYRENPNLFYQQDEWQTIGNNIILNHFFEVFSNFNLLNFIFVQERYASDALAYFLMGKFAFNTTLMGIYSLFFHIVNTVLVFIIIKKWVIKDNLFAFLGSLFFGISDVSLSAVSWFGTSLGTLPAVTLILFAIIFYFKYIERQKKEFLLIVLLFLYLSLFFKEVGIFLLLFLPFASLLFLKFKTQSFIATFWPFFSVFLLTTLIRLTSLVFLSDRSGELFVTSTQGNFIAELVTRAVMYPITSLSLTFIPPELLVSFAKIFTNTYYPFISSEHFNLVAQTVVIDIFAVFLTFVFLVVTYLAIREETKHTKRIVIFWIVFFVLSFLPYILLSKSFAYLESRYYYLANLPAGILLGLLGLSLQKFLRPRHLGILSIVLLTLFLGLHFKFLINDLDHLKLTGQERLNFLSQLERLKPTLDSNKNVFYLTGNHDYYIPGNKVPFQQGMGYTFMVLYYATGKVPKELIRERFLWDLNTQGYREINSFGFGFFSDAGQLERTVEKQNFAQDRIVTLYYDSNTKKLQVIRTKKQ